jgi:hypothetical protein
MIQSENVEEKTLPKDVNQTVTLTICQLISFLIANIVRTEKEWSEWGYPYLELIFCSQFNEQKGKELLKEFNSQFHPLIGHGICLWIDDTLNPTTSDGSSKQEEEEDYVIITLLEEKLKKVLANYVIFQENDLQIQLVSFFTKFYQYIASIDHYYDSRERTIARKVCSMLNLSAHQFSDLEKILSSSASDTVSDSFLLENADLGPYSSSISSNDSSDVSFTQKQDNLFLKLFNRHSHSIPRQSLLVSYRMWRVALIAAGGGALVGLAGTMAAPTIISTVLPVLTSAVSFTQISLTLDGCMGYIGFVTYSLIPSIFTTYGATVAGTVMMKRTAEIKEFELIPLHIHSERHQISRQQVYQEKDKTGLPIFILVNGHIEKNIDSRVMWGANGTDIILNECHVNTSGKKEDNETLKSDESVAIVEGNIEKSRPKDLLSTIEEDLLKEGQLLAESILQSFSSSLPSSVSPIPLNGRTLKDLPPPPPLSSSSSLLSNESYEDIGKDLTVMKSKPDNLTQSVLLRQWQ